MIIFKTYTDNLQIIIVTYKVGYKKTRCIRHLVFRLNYVIIMRILQVNLTLLVHMNDAYLFSSRILRTSSYNDLEKRYNLTVTS